MIAREILLESLISVDTSTFKEGHIFVILMAMEEYAKLYHETKLKNIRVADVIKSVCDLCDEEGWIHENKGDIMEHRLCKCNKQTVL